MIRFLLAVVYLLVVSVISLQLYLFVCIIGKFNARKKVEVSQKIVVFFFNLFAFLTGTKVDARGIENVPKDEAVLFMGNHRGYFDIVAVYMSVPVLVGFIAKKEVKKIPALGVWMKYINCLFLDREDKKEGLKTIIQAIDNVKNGYSMFIMPEGSRSKTYEMLPFKKGSFKIAMKANCKIVPVSIANSAEVFEKQFPRIKAKTIIVQYGKPIDLPNMSKEDLKQIDVITKQAIQEGLDKIREDV
ncbi:MAG: 1-acyl-sn-glycerol-3-phosphate acyltransferase [Clostridia bacterium]|nr:1-acyl-sn-glycerol-3-phosphate acyltransferase [Clostridia bacterium]